MLNAVKSRLSSGKKILLSISVIAVLALTLIGYSSIVNAKQADDGLPIFNVKVLQYMSSNPAEGVLVLYKQNGLEVNRGTTDGNGMVYWTVPAGYYDIYVSYRDSQSNQLLGHYHDHPEVVEISLGPWY